VANLAVLQFCVAGMELAWQCSKAERSEGEVFGAGGRIEDWRVVGNPRHVVPDAGYPFTFARGRLISFGPASPGSPSQFLQPWRTATDFHSPTFRSDSAPQFGMGACSQVSPFTNATRHDLHSVVNRRSSAWAIGGMVLLLAVCGWIVEGADGAKRAISAGSPRGNGPAISGEAMYRWFGARKLGHDEMPFLFGILADVCRRARLPTLPGLYYIAAPANMNAYALGSPNCAAIVITEGLLRGMAPDEITGILAHEVAHIRNNDAWAMSWVAALHRAIEWASRSALALLRARGGGAATTPLAALMNAAPAIARLLGLALCRSRELDADATALELTEDLQALIAALDKLERHHTGPATLAAAAVVDGSLRLLRSHPPTSERVETLRTLAHFRTRIGMRQRDRDAMGYDCGLAGL
jgi:heat shock protein HtpX